MTVRAALLCLLACGFFAAASALAKAAQTVASGPDLHPLQITAFRFVGALLVLSPLVMRRGLGTFHTTMPWRHVQRVLLGFGSVTCIFAALDVMPLADVVSIAWSAPLFALLFARVFLGERVGMLCWLAALVGFGGVAVMMQPGADKALLITLAAGGALASAVFSGGEIVTIRLLTRRDTALTALALNNLLGSVIACIAAAPVFVVPSLSQLQFLAFVGVAMVTGQFLFFKAIAEVEASTLAPFYYTTLLWAALIGVVVFGEIPGWRLYVGASMIVAGGLLIGWRTRKP